MKVMISRNVISKGLPIILICLLFLCISAQDECFEFYRTSDCIFEVKNKFQTYRGSTNVEIKPNEKHDFNVVLMGGRNYFITFCTIEEYYPINFLIINRDEGDTLYDNKIDSYINSIGFKLSKPSYYTISVETLAEGYRNTPVEEECLGMFIQYKSR